MIRTYFFFQGMKSINTLSGCTIECLISSSTVKLWFRIPHCRLKFKFTKIVIFFYRRSVVLSGRSSFHQHTSLRNNTNVLTVVLKINRSIRLQSIHISSVKNMCSFRRHGSLLQRVRAYFDKRANHDEGIIR